MVETEGSVRFVVHPCRAVRTCLRCLPATIRTLAKPVEAPLMPSPRISVVIVLGQLWAWMCVCDTVIVREAGSFPNRLRLILRYGHGYGNDGSSAVF